MLKIEKILCPVDFSEFSEKAYDYAQSLATHYEAKLFVRGAVKSLGTDCIEKEMRPEHLEKLAELLDKAGVADVKPEEFKRYGSARTLYNFNIDNADAY